MPAAMDSDDDMPLSAIMKPPAATNGTVSIKEEYDSDSSDDVPLSKQHNSVFRSTTNSTDSSSSDESDVPLTKLTTNGIKKATDHKKSKASDKNKMSSRSKVKRESDFAKKDSKTSRKRVKVEQNGDAKPAAKPAAKKEDSVMSKGSDRGFDDEESEDYKWWLDKKQDDSIKWTTLEHNGVLFPPPYEPHGVPLLYNGKPIYLEPEAEEAASFFAAMTGTEYLNNPIFIKNFFDDFLDVISRCKNKYPIKEFSKCDFSLISDHLAREREAKKNMSKEEKKVLREQRAKEEEKYQFCLLDGRKEKVGNFRIEPPGLFRGRGAHPKTGKIKQRVMPEQVTINIGHGAKVPDPPAGHRWADIVHDNKVTWLAMWKENVNGNIKYVFLAANSSLKGQSDFKKYEKARALKGCIAQIRRDYQRDLSDKVMAVRQRATALYFIDKLALRAGNEKGEDEADTVGCCSLRLEHVTLKPPNVVMFDFLGKDSIRYINEVTVEPKVFKNLKLFKAPPKTEKDLLFDRLNTASLNKHLNQIMDGLTAKVFRTYNASYTFQEELKKTPTDGTVAEKILAYNRANREVAVLCNHQRTVSKAHEGQMGRINDRILEIKYKRSLVKKQLKEIDPDYVKKHPKYGKKEEGLTSKWIKQYLAEQFIKEKEKLKKRFELDNEKRKQAGEPLIDEYELTEQLDAVAEKEKQLAKGEYEPDPPLKTNVTTERLAAKVDKLSEQLMNAETLAVDKEENKTTATITSRLNYIDPRITIAWCKKHNVPIEKLFSKTLREKFTWAMEVDESWMF